MKKIINDIREYSKSDFNHELIVFKVLDPLFEFLKDYVVIELQNLNITRSSFRMRNIETNKIGISSYEEFRKKRIETIKLFGILRELCPDLKTLSAISDLIQKSVIRSATTKIPQPPKDYLQEIDINEYDVDWIVKKIKDYFGKFVQTYSSERILYLLKENDNQ